MCSEEYDEYPIPFAAEFFDVTDERFSSSWRLSTVDPGEGEIQSSLLFEKWAKDPSFYERLLEDDPEAVEQFMSNRQFTEQE